MAPHIAVDKLVLRMGNRNLFDGMALSLTLRTGHINLISAPNGSGKTVLLDVLTMRTTSSHQAYIKWVGIEHATDVAYLPQRTYSLDDIFIRAMLALAFPHDGLPEPLRQFLRQHPYALSQRFGDLSGGMRQLLLFLIVSYRPQRAYFFDEPFRFLDEAARSRVWERLLELTSDDCLVVITDHERSSEMPESVVIHSLPREAGLGDRA